MATLELTIDEGVAAQPAKRGRRLGLLFWMAIGWMIFMFTVAILAPVLPLPSPTDMDMLERRAPFSMEHWLGTDGLGRDDFLNWFEAENSTILAEKLCESYQVNGQTAWSLLRKAERFRLQIVTALTENETRPMRLHKANSLDEILSRIDENQKGYIIPFGAKYSIKN